MNNKSWWITLMHWMRPGYKVNKMREVSSLLYSKATKSCSMCWMSDSNHRGIVSKSWVVSSARHILTTHARTHKPLYLSQRARTGQQPQILLKEVMCMWVCEHSGWMFARNLLGKWAIPARTLKGPHKQTVTNLFSFPFSHCRVCLGVMMTAEHVCRPCPSSSAATPLHLYLVLESSEWA